MKQVPFKILFRLKPIINLQFVQSQNLLVISVKDNTDYRMLTDQCIGKQKTREQLFSCFILTINYRPITTLQSIFTLIVKTFL